MLKLRPSHLGERFEICFEGGQVMRLKTPAATEPLNTKTKTVKQTLYFTGTCKTIRLLSWNTPRPMSSSLQPLNLNLTRKTPQHSTLQPIICACPDLNCMMCGLAKAAQALF